MFTFFQTIFEKVTSAVVGVVVAIGLIAPPTHVETILPGEATTTPIVQEISTEDMATDTSETEAKKPTADERDSIISNLKKQVAELTQKPKTDTSLVQPPVFAPKTTVVTLPSGATVEMDASGNVVRTIYTPPSIHEQMPSVRKELKVFLRDGVCRRNDAHGTVCSIDIFYYENGEQRDEEMTISSNDPDGFFIGCRNEKQGKTITCPTRRDVYDGKPVGVFAFIPSANQSGVFDRTVIVSAGGISKSKVIKFEYQPEAAPIEAEYFKPPEVASIEVKNLNTGKMYGGYCSAASLNWVVKDQYGNDFKVTDIKINGQTITQNPYQYKSPNFHTVEELTFSYGELSTTTRVQVDGSMREERGEDDFFQESPERWRSKSTGAAYYPLTDTCKNVTPLAPVVKELKFSTDFIQDDCFENENGRSCRVYIKYLEDGIWNRDVEIRVTSSDPNGRFYCYGIPEKVCVYTQSTKDRPDYFIYRPDMVGFATLTATANGVQATARVTWQIEKCAAGRAREICNI